MKGQNGNGIAQNSQLMDETGQEINSDEWDETKLAALLGFDDSPEISPELVMGVSELESATFPLAQNTVSQSELFDDPIAGKTKPSFSGNPFAKSGVVGLGLLIIFAAGGLVLNTVMGSKLRQAPSVASNASKLIPNETPTVSVTQGTETGKLKTQVALGEQADQIKDLEKSKSPKPNAAKTKTQQTALQPPPSSSPPRTVPASYPRNSSPSFTPRTASYSAPLAASTRSQPVSSAPLPTSKSVEPKPQEPPQKSAIEPKPQKPPQKSAIDPMQQWIGLARIGSYGSTDLGEKAPDVQATNPNRIPASHSTSLTSTLTPTVGRSPFVTIPRAIPVVSGTNGGVASLESVPFPSVAVSASGTNLPPNETSSPRGESSETSIPVTVPEQISQENTVASSAPTQPEGTLAQVNPAEEASILSGVKVRSLQVGDRAQGQLVTPVIWAGNEARAGATKSTQESPAGEKFIVQLQEPLTDKGGFVTLPIGTQIVAQVIEVNESGWLKLNVSQIVVDNQEYMLPLGAISIRGVDGQPLMASKWGDRGSAIASGDISTFLFGSLSKVGQVLTQPDSQSSTTTSGFGFSSSTTNQSGGRNLLGAILDGGFTPLTQQILKRNEQRIQELTSRPDVWYVPVGTSVQVFVNQSFEF
ncbi:MAG TPA: TrbI/VirB10 family protein [Oculatellaceae cyanobacterium]